MSQHAPAAMRSVRAPAIPRSANTAVAIARSRVRTGATAWWAARVARAPGEALVFASVVGAAGAGHVGATSGGRIRRARTTVRPAQGNAPGQRYAPRTLF
ncbi:MULTISPECIES: hypothetical protein [unclassified Streptomyces]|uniref:hypothetical protein n=1 Tax=unclassified Streptomyces TaxID=2593676 RepID=UPI00341A794F